MNTEYKELLDKIEMLEKIIEDKNNWFCGQTFKYKK